MDGLNRLPFRVGTTSYILADDILPNARYLAGKVLDIEIVLFEIDDSQDNLPSTEAISELELLARNSGLTYTVHLPLDLRLEGDGGESHPSILKARRAIQATQPLSPQAYIVHLDGRAVRTAASHSGIARWIDQAVSLLEVVSEAADDPRLLAVENLEGYPPEFWDPVLERFPASRCMDIGHLWLDGIDPLPYLAHALPEARVIHLHGVDRRDHASLAHVEAEKLDVILHYLLEQRFPGILTIEVFNDADLTSSLSAVKSSLERFKPLPPTG